MPTTRNGLNEIVVSVVCTRPALATTPNTQLCVTFLFVIFLLYFSILCNMEFLNAAPLQLSLIRNVTPSFVSNLIEQGDLLKMFCVEFEIIFVQVKWKFALATGRMVPCCKIATYLYKEGL